jgi:hypothetical protein
MGQVESGALFLNICWGKINGDVRRWNVIPTVLQCRANAVTTLAHGRVGQTDGVEMVLIALDTGHIHFDFDDAGIDAIDGGTKSFVEHRAELGIFYLSPHAQRKFVTDVTNRAKFPKWHETNNYVHQSPVERRLAGTGIEFRSVPHFLDSNGTFGPQWLKPAP